VNRPLLALLVIAVAAATGACASTGATPHPFPIPGGSTSRAEPSPPSPAPPLLGPSADAANPPAASPAPMPPARLSADTYALTGTALSLRGTPYVNGGADPNGFDCSGFTQYVFGHHGIALPREVKEQFATGQPVPAAEIAPGDLMFFTTVAPGASHVGISLGGDEFVHAPSSTGVVRVERVSSTYWSQRFVGARRVN
jgi:cell wall-associated NlpC family hydrolase